MLTGLDTILYVHRNYVFLNTEYYPPLALNGKLDFQTSHLATTSKFWQMSWFFLPAQVQQLLSVTAVSSFSF